MYGLDDLLSFEQLLTQVNARLGPDKEIRFYQLNHAIRSRKIKSRPILLGNRRYFLVAHADELAAYFQDPQPPGRTPKRLKAKSAEYLRSPLTGTLISECEGRELDAWLHASFGYHVDFKHIDASDVPGYTRDRLGFSLAHLEFWKNNYPFWIKTSDSWTDNVRRMILFLHDFLKLEYSQRQAALYRAKAHEGDEECSQPPKFKQTRKQKRKGDAR